ncbi:glutathione S-transferase [Acidithiobacillus sp. AMEEHan]|uniref:glutathione S-transferase n=1 Tax=Acidithiobacillus sp. AMEEHan TaxID=2994951 RepID=UPI0027E50405|nr:glutathione S-transferase [Acidithiobacillus sp. AMEEHan]
MLNLIHFDFCPFCQRVRLALGYKRLPCSVTPARFYGPQHFLAISGFERLPVVVYPDGTRQGESLEIIAELDRRYPATPRLQEGVITPTQLEDVLAWRKRISDALFRLIAPTLPQYPSLGDDPRAMRYYRERMESWLGDTLEGLAARRHEWYAMLLPELGRISERVCKQEFYGETFSIADTLITGDLTGLRLLADIKLPPELTAYFERVEEATGVGLLPTF